MSENDDAAEAARDEASRHMRDYRLTFGAPWSQAVLQDLMRFCRFRVPHNENGSIDIHRTLVMEGRREVFLRIVQRLNLAPEQLLQLYGGHTIKLGEEDG